jgi:hypothetical protein
VFVGLFETTSKVSPAQFFVVLSAANPITGLSMTWEEVVRQYPVGQFARQLQVTASWDAQNLTLNWTSDIGGQGRAVLPRSCAARASEYSLNPVTWDEFKKHVIDLEPRRFVFRGQRTPGRLRTTYHRSGRADLVRYAKNDIPTLHQNLSARTRHLFNLRDPLEFGAFLHLGQHHGYPTPLLDWSYSAFVAGFFAYRSILNSEARSASGDDRVRIFKFDRLAWLKDFAEESKIDTLKLHLSFYEFLAVDNERMIPQQALSILTNIDDVESYIRLCDQRNKRTYLEVFDVPVQGRHAIMRELSMMGITAGSLLPGLDGSCAELRERFFE